MWRRLLDKFFKTGPRPWTGERTQVDDKVQTMLIQPPKDSLANILSEYLMRTPPFSSFYFVVAWARQRGVELIAIKGLRVAHCHIDLNPYPNGYYLRTDLDKITSERFPNFAVVGRNVKESNAHFQKCEHLSMPFCVVKRQRNYACFTVDFITTESLGMDAVIGKAIREFRLLYRASHPARRLNRKHLYDSIMLENQERSLIVLLWIYVNDIYIVANVLMPILNDQSHWVKPGPRRCDNK